MLGRRCRSVPIPRESLRQGATQQSAAQQSVSRQHAVAAAGTPARGASSSMLGGAADEHTPSNFDTAFAVSERSLASASPRLRDSVASSAFNFAQLAAAIVVGIVIGKAAHLVMAEENALAWSATSDAVNGLRAEPSRGGKPGLADDSVESGAGQGTRGPFEVSTLDSPPLDATALDGSASGRAAPEAALLSTTAFEGGAALDAAGVDAARTVGRGNLAFRGRRAASRLRASSNARASQRASSAQSSASSRLGSQRAPSRAVSASLLPSAVPSSVVSSPVGLGVPVPVSVPLLDTTSDDWLGEQLAILARAERGLLQGDPESAARSVDEYRARFPNGLLDPQIAAVRQRIEDRFTAFIFP